MRTPFVSVIAYSNCSMTRTGNGLLHLDLRYDTKPSGSIMARPDFIELPTRDLTASQAFFENIFGMKMTGFGPTYACTMSGERGSWASGGPGGGV